MASSLGPPSPGTFESEAFGSPCSPHSSPSQTSNGKYYNPVVMEIIREDWIQQQLQLRQAAYTELRPTHIVIGTWNVNAKKPLTATEAMKIVHWLLPPTESPRDPPDLVAVGFQEIVDLNAVNVVVNSALTVQRSAAWAEVVLTALNRYIGAASGTDEPVQYRVVMEKHLVGILLLVFVKTTHWEHVKEVKGATAGVGIMGVMGNKGGVAIRLKFYSSTLCFVCAHLAAHRENIAGRNADYLNILSKIQFDETGDEGMVQDISGRFWSGEEASILNHDVVFWSGDLNYRIQDTLTTDEIFQLAEHASAYAELMQHDQLTKERRTGRVLQGFEEGPLMFRPTYKYQTGTAVYEKRPEKKLRAPAWCDRILWKAKTPRDVRLTAYGAQVHLNLSDHKPVYAHFDVQVIDQVETKKNDVMRDIMLQLDKWENENMPKVRLRGATDTSVAGTSGTNGVFAFHDLKFGLPQTKVVTIENTGLVVAHFRFIPKLEDVTVCKAWLSIAPLFGMIPPRETREICITALIETTVAHGLTRGDETLDDTMILRVENGRDYFLVVSGQYAPSCFGTSLEQLVACVEPIRCTSLTTARTPSASVFSVWVGGTTGVDATSILASQGPPDASSVPVPKTQKVPKELWRMVNDLYTHSLQEKNLFVEAGNKDEMVHLREALDTCRPFPPHSGYSTAELLVRWLQALRQSVVPDDVLALVRPTEPMAQTCRTLLDSLPPVRYNVVVYLVSFLREVLVHRAANKLSPEKLAFVFSRCLVASTTAAGVVSPSLLPRVVPFECQPPTSYSSTLSTASSSSNQSTTFGTSAKPSADDRGRRDALDLESAQARATQRADKMEQVLLHLLSVALP